MKNKWIGLILVSALLTGLVACTGKPTAENTPVKTKTEIETESLPIPPENSEELIEIFHELYENSSRFENYWYHGNTTGLEINFQAEPIVETLDFDESIPSPPLPEEDVSEATDSSIEMDSSYYGNPDGNIYWYPVVTFQTLEELKTETEKYFTKEFAEKSLYSSDTFKEFDGVLYVHNYSSSDFEPSDPYSEKITETKILTLTDSEIVIDAYYHVANDQTQDMKQKYVYFLESKGDSWVVANKRFSSDNSFLTEEITTELEKLTTLMQDAKQPVSVEAEDIIDAVKEQQTVLENNGYEVRSLSEDVKNVGRIKDFFNSEENGSIEILYLDGYTDLQLMGDIYIRDDEGLSVIGINIFSDLLGEYYYDTSGEKSPLVSAKITDHGNFITGYSFDGETSFLGYRFISQPEEYILGFDTYISPINSYSGLLLGTDWNKDNEYQGLLWAYLFDELWSHNNEEYLWDDAGPYAIEEGNVGIPVRRIKVPVDVVEQTISEFFELTLEQLKVVMVDEAGTPLYDSESDSFIFESSSGDYMGPLEIWDIKTNTDATIEITVAMTAFFEGNDGKEYSVVTVKPDNNGGFKYLSNKTL